MTPSKPQATPIPKKRGRAKGSTLTAAQKKAMSDGRTAASAVKNYLYALEHGVPVTAPRQTSTARIDRWVADLATESDVMKRLELQAKIDNAKNKPAEEAKPTTTMEALETEFIANAKHYATSKSIPRSAFEAMGVDKAVLDKAGI